MSLRAPLAALLRETAEAHHQAFRATDGFDPGWPAWYARHLLEARVDRLLEAPLDRTQLTALLVEADQRHRAQAPTVAWEDFYATFLLDSKG